MTRINSGVPIKRIQAPAKNDKKKLQVRNRFEALRTDDEEFPLGDEYDDAGLPETTAKKQHQGRIQNQTHKHRTMSTRLNSRGDGNEVNLCPLEREDAWEYRRRRGVEVDATTSGH